MPIYKQTTEITKIDDVWANIDRDIVEVYFGDKNIFTVWGEYDSTLPIAITANGDALLDYRIYGADSGVGEPTENLFDYTTNDVNNGYISSSYISADGEVTSSIANWCVSEYIQIQSNTNYFLKIDTGGYNDRGIAFYDSNKNYISGLNYRYGITNLPFLTSSNAEFVRLTIRKSTEQQVMLVEGSTAPTSYIPYGYKLPMTVSVNYEYVFTGNESFSDSYGRYQFSLPKAAIKESNASNTSCSHFPYGTGLSGSGTFSFEIGRYVYFGVRNEYPTIPDFKQFLTDQYNAGTPMTLRYFLAPSYFPVYIGDTPLGEDEYVSYSEQAIYKRTENLCPPLSSSKWSPGYISNIGTIATPGTIRQEKVSDWIKVDGGNSYCFYDISGFPAGDENAWFAIGAWDENRNWLRRYSWEAKAVSYKTCDLTNDVAYVRLSMRTYGEDDDNLSFTKSSIPPDPYIPYLKLTDPPVPLPTLPTIDGATIIDCELADKPDEMYCKYRKQYS